MDSHAIIDAITRVQNTLNATRLRADERESLLRIAACVEELEKIKGQLAAFAASLAPESEVNP